jgi:ubiquinone/menaquinone biosynthesis C-methylase UbiE
MNFNLWDARAYFYHHIRYLPILWQIYNTEIKNLKMLISQETINPSFVLDIGTGTASSLKIFHSDIKIVGLDISLGMLVKALKRKNNLSALAAETSNLPIQDSVVPFISAIGLTEYISKKETFIEEVKRIIKADGYFLVTISQPGILNILRNFFGSRIYTIRNNQWETLMEKTGWIFINKTKSLFQMQYLYRANKDQ